MSAPLWLPGAVAVPSAHDGGSMTGSDAYATFHTFEGPYSLTAVNAAKRLIAAGNEVTLTFNPVLGGIAQMVPANRAGRGLMNNPGGVETNRQGKVNIQIEVVAYAAHPWTQDLTEAGRADLRRLLAWLDALGVPRTHPAGDQGPGPNGPFNRSTAAWNGSGGYFCHGDVPENWHWDHGGVKFSDVWAAAAPVAKPVTPAKPVPVVPAKPVPSKPVTPAKPAEPKQPSPDPAAVKRLQSMLEIPADGKWGDGTDQWAIRLRTAARGTGPFNVRAVQAVIDVTQDGAFGPKSKDALAAWVKSLQRLLGVTADGDWGPATDKAFLALRAANKGRF